MYIYVSLYSLGHGIFHRGARLLFSAIKPVFGSGAALLKWLWASEHANRAPLPQSIFSFWPKRFLIGRASLTQKNVRISLFFRNLCICLYVYVSLYSLGHGIVHRGTRLLFSAIKPVFGSGAALLKWLWASEHTHRARYRRIFYFWSKRFLIDGAP